MDRIETILRQNTNSFLAPFEELYAEHLGKIAEFDLINNWSLGRTNIPESILTGIAKEHEGVLKGFDFLDPEKQKAISKDIADSLELLRLQREAKLKKLNFIFFSFSLVNLCNLLNFTYIY